MERIIINTELDGFIWPGNVTEISKTRITSMQSFDDVPDVIGLEALAQLAAFHARFLIELERHVFLMKIRGCTLPAGSRISGTWRLEGIRESSSDRTWLYRLTAARETDGDCFGGVFLFGSVNYDENFKKDVLQSHYRKVFSCSKTG